MTVSQGTFMEALVNYAKVAAYLGAAFAIGIGTMGPSLGQGAVGSRACENIGKYPESAGSILAAMYASLVAIETSAIYVLLIAGGLLYLGYIS
jgi:F-type H+-transporting ATPase subunit c